MTLVDSCKCGSCVAMRMKQQKEDESAEKLGRKSARQMLEMEKRNKTPANKKDKDIIQLKAEVERLKGMIDFNEEQYDECCRNCHIMLEGENKQLKGIAKEAEEHIELLQDKLHKVEKELKEADSKVFAIGQYQAQNKALREGMDLANAQYKQLKEQYQALCYSNEALSRREDKAIKISQHLTVVVERLMLIVQRNWVIS